MARSDRTVAFPGQGVRGRVEACLEGRGGEGARKAENRPTLDRTLSCGHLWGVDRVKTRAVFVSLPCPNPYTTLHCVMTDD